MRAGMAIKPVLASMLLVSALAACKKEKEAPKDTKTSSSAAKTTPKAEPAGEPAAEPAAEPAKPAANALPGEPLGACPAASAVTEATTPMEGYAENGTVDWSTIKTAKALMRSDKTVMYLYLSNAEVSGPDLARIVMKVPLTEKGTAILQLTFANKPDPVSIGKYDPGAGYGKPMGVTADLVAPIGEKGTSFGLSVSTGHATIVDSKDGKVCGTFELAGESGSAKGEFVADLLDDYGK
jgi:hypothetical protein